jgi:sulfhydrogenase subunit gamma (sulfur reductase)
MNEASIHKASFNVTPKSLYCPIPCRLDEVRDLTPTEKLFRLSREDGQHFGHRPGQFVQVSLFGYGEAPISVSSSPTRGPYLELGVRRIGALTGALHQLRPGDTVGIRGPFGTCFDIPSMQGRDLLLISGGCGLAPLRSLIQYCEDRREEFGRITILYGAKTPDDQLYQEDLASWARQGKFDCRYTVDTVPPASTWDSQVGLITTLIPPLSLDPAKTTAVVVGPPVMYRFVIQELNRKGIADHHIFLSLERHMKCGVGKCGHCAIDHLYCCLDGPVFRLDRIRHVRGALE